MLQALQALAAIIGIPTLVAIAWKFASSVARLEAQVEDIRTNDLVHIYTELQELRRLVQGPE